MGIFYMKWKVYNETQLTKTSGLKYSKEQHLTAGSKRQLAKHAQHLTAKSLSDSWQEHV